jgi:opacity protein-like surface antigen
MKKFCFTLCLALISSHALAGGYAGVDYVFSTIEPEETTRDADVGALQFKFGTWLNPEGTLGAEFRAALGTTDDEIGNTDVEIDRYYGGYLRGQFPNNVPIRPYGILGLTRVETSFKNGRTKSEDYSDVSLGIGADMDVSNQVFITLEYLRAVDRSGDEVSNLSLGVGGRF